MLWQIKTILRCQFPDLSKELSSISDPRKGEHYSIEELVMAAVVLFILKCSSRNDFNNKCQNEQFRRNYYRMFSLELPQMDAVNDLFKKLDDSEMQAIRCRLISSLIEKRVFHKFRFYNKYFYIAIDGTGIYNWGENPPEDIRKHALTKKYDSGKVIYFSLILEAVLLCNNGMKIPLISEWIANDGEKYDKQDCELKAFKRLAVKLKKYFPRLNICLLTDGLYTNISMMDICRQYGWKYITVFKDGNLSSVWEEVESLLPLTQKDYWHQQIQGNTTNWIESNYRWIKDIDYNKHYIHWIECLQKTIHRKTGVETNNRFVFLTNFEVDRQNIAFLLKAGRARWYIEDHFNTQKNRGGALHHKFSRKDFNALKNWHNIRQLGCMIIELLIHTAKIQEQKKEYTNLTWMELWKILNSYLSMCDVEEQIEQWEQWAKTDRQVRLE